MLKSILVKGNRHDAITSAARYGIALAYVRQVDETIVAAFTLAAEATLNTWLDETKQPPFPPGSLLLWSYAKPDGTLTTQSPGAVDRSTNQSTEKQTQC